MDYWGRQRVYWPASQIIGGGGPPLPTPMHGVRISFWKPSRLSFVFSFAPPLALVGYGPDIASRDWEHVLVSSIYLLSVIFLFLYYALSYIYYPFFFLSPGMVIATA